MNEDDKEVVPDFDPRQYIGMTLNYATMLAIKKGHVGRAGRILDRGSRYVVDLDDRQRLGIIPTQNLGTLVVTTVERGHWTRQIIVAASFGIYRVPDFPQAMGYDLLRPINLATYEGPY